MIRVRGAAPVAAEEDLVSRLCGVFKERPGLVNFRTADIQFRVTFQKPPENSVI
jgi:hypothetical protein